MPNSLSRVIRTKRPPSERSAGHRGSARTLEVDDMMKTQVHGARLLLSAGIAVTLAIGMLAVERTANAAGPAPVGLGTAAPFAVLAGTPAVTNTGAP
jgi:hypothetical protein